MSGANAKSVEVAEKCCVVLIFLCISVLLGGKTEAWQNPTHPEHERLRQWVGASCDPELFLSSRSIQHWQV
jgi:hypothetical protein